MQVLNVVFSNVCLPLQCIVFEAVAVLRSIVGIVHHLGHIDHLKAVLVFSPHIVLGKFLIFLGCDAYFQFGGVATNEDVLATDYEVLGAKSNIAVGIGVYAAHNQVQCLQAGTSHKCRVGDGHRHTFVHLCCIIIQILEPDCLYLLLATEGITTNGHSLVVVGRTDIVIHRHRLLVRNIAHIHMIDGMLVFCHYPLPGHEPSRFATGLFTDS